MGLVLMLPLLWAAPWLIAHSPAGNWLLAKVMPADGGSVRVESLRLGWFSPIAAGGIELRDLSGKLLLAAPVVEGEVSLVQLLLDRSQIGVLRIQQPQLQVTLRSDGSNVEDYLMPWLATDEPGAELPTLTVDVVDGTVHVRDVPGAREWKLTDVNAEFSILGNTPEPIRTKITATITDGQTKGRIAAECRFPIAEMSPGSSPEPCHVALTAQAVPLVLTESLVARFAEPVQLAGTLTTKLDTTWNGAHGSVRGEVSAEGLLAVSPALQDRIHFDQLTVPCHVEWKPGRMTIHQLRVTCDVGELDVGGELNPQHTSVPTLLQSLAREKFFIKGQIDLVRLAALMPQTLHIRPDTNITSGRVQLALTSGEHDGMHRWQGELKTSGLAALREGRRFAWDQPIEINLTAYSGHDGLVVDVLDCRSDFLQVRASGTPRKLAGSAKLNLGRLAEQLGQFVELGDWQIAGQGNIDFDWSQAADGNFTAEATSALQDFRLTSPDEKPWEEELLAVHASASGRRSGRALERVNTATATLTSGSDRLAVELRGAVDQPQSSQSWPLHVALEGRIERWLTRLRPWFTLSEVRLDGDARLQALAVCRLPAFDVEQSTLEVNDFKLQSHGLWVNEPKVELQASGRWDGIRRLDVAKALLKTGHLTVDANRISAELPAGQSPRLAGAARVEGKLEALAAWFREPAAAEPAWAVAGGFGGTLSVSRQTANVFASADLTLTEVQLAQRKSNLEGRSGYDVVWRDPRITLVSAATYDSAADRLDVRDTHIRAQTATLTAAGKIEMLSTDRVIDATGTVDYDLVQVSPLLRPYVGGGIQLVGRNTARFHIEGPLAEVLAKNQAPAAWSQRLQGNLSLGWQSGSIHGLALGGGRLETHLSGGRLTVRPLSVDFSEGRLTSTPAVRFDPAPTELTLPEGPLLTDVRLSPEACNAALKYIAPVLADATRPDGRFSVDLQGGRIPLAAPAGADVAGRMRIHQVQVLPGPLAAELIFLVQQIESIARRRAPTAANDVNQTTLLKISDQDVVFRMVEGRVYHQNLEFIAGDVPIRTHGSVGLDQSLALVADVPVQDKWLGTDVVSQGIKGQTVQITVGGTLAKPQIDQRAVEQLAGKLLKGAAEKAITNELGKQLDKLFGPRR